MKKVNWKKASQFEGPEESPGFLLWQVSMGWRRKIEVALAALGLTHPQFVLLASVGWLTRGGEQVTQIELARHSNTDITVTSQVLRTLEKKGYIAREKKDERSKLPRLTESGSKLIEEAIPVVEAVDHQFFGKLGPEMKKYIEIFQKLI